MEYVSEIDKYLAGCVEQIKAMWQDLRQSELLSEFEETERQQNLHNVLVEVPDE